MYHMQCIAVVYQKTAQLNPHLTDMETFFMSCKVVLTRAVNGDYRLLAMAGLIRHDHNDLY